MPDIQLQNQETPNSGLKIEPAPMMSGEPDIKMPEPEAMPPESESQTINISGFQNKKALEKAAENSDEKIVLDIGDISEIAPGRGPKPGISLTGNVAVDWYRRINNYILAMTPVNIREKMVFYQLLSTMIGAGVSLIKALDILSQQTKNAKFKRVIWDVANDIEKGSSFSESLSRYPTVFDESEIGMISSGEAAGRLHEVMTQLAIQVEKSANLYNKVKGALMYPIIIFCILGVSVFTMMTLVIPKLSTLFTSTGKELPAATKRLLAASDFMVNHWLFLIMAIVATILLFISWKKTPGGKRTWDALKLKFPIFGNLYRNIALARFARSLSALLLSGIPIIKSLEINAHAVGNEVYRDKLLAAAEDVSKGIPLGENLSANEAIFPPMVVYMVAVGEKTAQIGEMTGKIADYYENEVEAMTQGFMKLIEPLVIAILGIVIGSLILAIMEPILSLSDISEGL